MFSFTAWCRGRPFWWHEEEDGIEENPDLAPDVVHMGIYIYWSKFEKKCYEKQLQQKKL